MTLPEYPRARVEARLRSLSIERTYRIVRRQYSDRPLESQPMQSRFCDASYSVIYAASTLHAAVLETVIRDQFVRAVERTLRTSTFSDRVLLTLKARANMQLLLLDLRETGCVELGAPTDAVRARNHQAGQAFGRAIYTEHSHVDGLIYSSRFAETDNYAIFDRATHKLELEESGDLSAHPDLAGIFIRNGIHLVDG